MLRAIIFDFDGVIVDSEPLIMDLTIQMAAREGWTLTADDYYRDYLALDDRGIVEHLYRTHGLPVDGGRRDEMVRWKATEYMRAVHDGLPALPGALEFVRRASERYPLGIASGSSRDEVEFLLGTLGLRGAFPVLSTADDCERSKPDPCAYLTALAKLNRLDGFAAQPLLARQCLAIEDAPAGIDAAHTAGMKCMAVAHSRPASELRRAEWVYGQLADADFSGIVEAFNLAALAAGDDRFK